MSLEISNLFSVKGMIYVITGGGSGIGSWMAESLAINGARKVFILGRREASLQQIASKHAEVIVPVVCDIASRSSLEAAVKTIESQVPFVNVVVANAGYLGPALMTETKMPDANLSELKDYLWSASRPEHIKILDVNVAAQYDTFLAFVDLLDAANKHSDSPSKSGYVPSQFILITSIAGYSRREMSGYVYGASKAAAAHMTKTLSTGFQKFGIRVNSIAPGMYRTEMTDFFFEGIDDPAVPGAMPAETIPLKRTGNAEDIAGAIIFLTSRAAGYITGEVLAVEGGYLAINPSTY